MIKPSEYRALAHQAKRLEERRTSPSFDKIVSGIPLHIATGVYQTSGDSELMAECVHLNAHDQFLEIGCGCGFVTLALSQRAKRGVGVDINEKAIQNSQENAHRLRIENVQFITSNLFANVDDKYDVIICNPPYTDHPCTDTVDYMFWDENNIMKRQFFKEASQFLKPDGRIYFGWADFADLDIDLPYKLAMQNGYSHINTYKKNHQDDFNFYVLEFLKAS